MYSNEIKKYKLERKNVFYNWSLKGLCFLGGVVITSGIPCLLNHIPEYTIVDIISDETLLVTTGVCVISLVKTLPITSKIHKLKRKTRKRME